MSQPPYPPAGGSEAGQGGYEGPPGYGRSYGQQPYGQAPYGQAPYGRDRPGATVPPWGRAASTTATSTGVALALSAGLGVLLAAAAVALFVVFGSGDGAFGSGTGGSALPAATSEPEGLGDDAELDGYAEECHEGDMASCDELYRSSPRGSAYELYGGTCAGRQSNIDAREIYCVEAFPPPS